MCHTSVVYSYTIIETCMYIECTCNLYNYHYACMCTCIRGVHIKLSKLTCIVHVGCELNRYGLVQHLTIKLIMKKYHLVVNFCLHTQTYHRHQQSSIARDIKKNMLTS